MPRLARPARGIVKPSEWNVDPAFVAPEWQWAWRGLRFAAPLWEGGGPPFDPISRTLATLHGSPTWEEGANGYGLTCNADSEVVSFDLPFTLGGAGGSFSVFIVARTDGDLTARQRAIVLKSSTGSSQYWIDFHGGTTNDQAESGLNDATNGFSGTDAAHVAPYEVGRTYRFGATLEEGVSLRAYSDGVLGEEQTGATQTAAEITDLHIGNNAQSTLAQAGPTFACYVWDRALTDREHRLIARDPFGPFRMARRTWSVVEAVAAQLLRPDADVENPDAWEDELGGTTDIYLSIDEETADDADWIQGPVAAASEPVVEDVVETTFSTQLTSHVIDLPATVEDGDLLLLLHNHDDQATLVSSPSGWTTQYEHQSTRVTYAKCYLKVGEAADSGGTVTIELSPGEAGAAQVYRISGWSGTLADVEHALSEGLDDSPDPPSLTPSWGGDNALWLAVSYHGDDDSTVSSAPANYTDLVDSPSGAGTDKSANVGSARRLLSATSEDPGAFTLSEEEDWVAATIALPPAA